MSGGITDDERAVLRRLASLPEDQQDRLFEVATMPERDWEVIRAIPSQRAFWLGVAATVVFIGSGVWGLLAWLGSEKSADAAQAAARALQHHQ